MKGQVNVWVEEVMIPTYLVGKPEKNPMFLEKRVYQGSSGVVYPHAVVEKISDEKVNKSYKGIYLENQYIKILVLPELGGRIQMAYDKIKERHFIYYNQVIKPALVGLTGPWISGGIEFNWPQHHRPSTFDPIDFTIEENDDGSKTIWVNEVERMFRTKGMAGFTLHPDKAYIEIKGKLYNRTPFPQTFLWWANPAVKVNDHYQSVFPPDVFAVFDHGKRDVSSFPIAKAVYYKVDYSPGTDISRYKNIPVPTSYMAIVSKYDFIGGYEHDSKGGLLHVADHHISPGKKQWTWGNGEFGKAWDRNLTDEDGPYIELMTGVYTDNQPDFSWIQPYEEKTFVQYFMPYQEVGMVKNASKEAIINLELVGNQATIKLYVTSEYSSVNIMLLLNGNKIFNDVKTLSPGMPYVKTVLLNETFSEHELELVITDQEKNKRLISYSAEKFTEQEIPSPAVAPLRPSEVENNEQLYLTGLHIEQYRHATYIATDYYSEALRRDDKDVRNNNAMGLWYIKRGQFSKAEPYLRKAIKTLTQRNPNPYDGEPYYNLGLSLKMQGNADEAYQMFFKAVWNDPWQHAGYLNLARIAVEKKNFEEALGLIEKSIVKNYHSHTARHLKCCILRNLNKTQEAIHFCRESLIIDPFNFGCLFEMHLLYKDQNAIEAQSTLNHLIERSRNSAHNFIEYALDYSHAGLYDEAITLLQLHLENVQDTYPMVQYYLGYFESKRNDEEKAKAHFVKAASLHPDCCFPNRIEDVLALQKAALLNSGDANAHYYLGNLWYDKRQYEEAIQCWEKSVALNNSFPTAHRNLSLAYYNKLNNISKARNSLETAFELDKADARVLMELDQLYKKLNQPIRTRLELLEKHLDLVQSRDDLFLERITLYNQLGEYEIARKLINSFNFHPWEGGEGKVVGQYLISLIELAKKAINKGNFEEALTLLDDAEIYPPNLGEGKLYGVQENDIFYLKGVTFEGLGERDLAQYNFLKATEGISEPVQAIFYNDPQPDKIFYQGLAWMKLNEYSKAQNIFTKLIQFGEQHVNDNITIDYFAVSLPDLLVFDADLNLRNKIHCIYLQALGYLGLRKGNMEQAEQYFDEVLSLDINHQGAIIHKQMIRFLILQEKASQQNFES